MSQTESNGISLNDAVAISPDVVFELVNGEAVLLDLKSGTYLSLNRTGTDIWNALVSNGSLAAAHAWLLEQYAVEPAVAEAELLDLVAQLMSNGLVVRLQ